MAARPGVRESGFRLPTPVVSAMRTDLAEVGEKVVAAVIGEVPVYSEPFRGRMGRNIETAVTIALGGFLDLASSEEGIGPGSRVQSVFDAGYALGRGEARSGRTMDALTAAYRVGARTAWRDMSAIAVRAGLPAEELAQFAELVFDYIDQISAVSVSGHADELASTGRERERHLERLAASIIGGGEADALLANAERADWTPPRTLTAVLLPQSSTGTVRAQLDSSTLVAADAGTDGSDTTVLLVPNVEGSGRGSLHQVLRDRGAVIGPARPWQEGRASYLRALRGLGLVTEGRTIDTEEHLAVLMQRFDPSALADLRARVLAPLADLRPATADKLAETLRLWLLHQGRRDEVASALFVHPQTVRYRMGQLREVYGDQLTDPDFVRDAVIALS